MKYVESRALQQSTELKRAQEIQNLMKRYSASCYWYVCCKVNIGRDLDTLEIISATNACVDEIHASVPLIDLSYGPSEENAKCSLHGNQAR